MNNTVIVFTNLCNPLFPQSAPGDSKQFKAHLFSFFESLALMLPQHKAAKII